MLGGGGEIKRERRGNQSKQKRVRSEGGSLAELTVPVSLIYSERHKQMPDATLKPGMARDTHM